MKKDDMIQINSALITNENKRCYLEYYETIWETIRETYCCLFYLEGIEQHFGKNFVKAGTNGKEFIINIVKLLQQKVCLNISKLVLDKGKDVLTIYQMQDFIRSNFKLIISAPHITIATDLESSILNMRNTFISHNLHADKGCSIDMRELKHLLEDIYSFFQKLWIKDFVTDHLFISDGYFDTVKFNYVEAPQIVFWAVKP